MEIPVVKNKEYIVDIIDNGFEGEGIAKVRDYTIFIPGAIKGEKAKILIVKVTTSHAFGKIIELLKKSEHRMQEDCQTYKRCGGCNLRHIDYEKTLEIKEQTVRNLIRKGLKSEVIVDKVIGMGNPYHYRNKAQYPFGMDKKGEPVVGIYANRTHEIIPIHHCFIQNPISEKIVKYINTYIKQEKISVYNEKTRKGILRHVVIKIGIQTNEVMCILVLNGERLPKESVLVDKLTQQFPMIKTIVKNINTENTNVILGNKNINLYGNGYIYDILGEYKFKISPMSFYQTNPVQTEVLYHTAMEQAKLDKKDVIWDLYCGIGTIGIFASSFVKKVYGIEVIEQAVRDAKENAMLNHIDNIEFLLGAVENTLHILIKDKKAKPDAVFVDPPRKGLDKETIQNLINIKPSKIIYISCNPATMVRDLVKLEEVYEIKKIQPVDMFPFTSHIEVVTILNLK